MKPIVQLVFEDLYHVGFREFCFVVGRGQRTIRDHFTPDPSLLSILDGRGNNGLAKELEVFYDMVDGSRISWVNQPEPRGFGDAVMRTENYVDGERFLLHAGDNFFISKNLDHLKRLLNLAETVGTHTVFLVQEVQDPSRHGVVEAAGESNGLIQVRHVVEKPKSPVSNLAIMPVYTFQPTIFGALRETRQGYGGELQLTDGIEKLIEREVAVYGLNVNSRAVRLDVGSPDSYLEAQLLSYRYASEVRRGLDQDRPHLAPVPETV